MHVAGANHHTALSNAAHTHTSGERHQPQSSVDAGTTIMRVRTGVDMPIPEAGKDDKTH